MESIDDVLTYIRSRTELVPEGDWIWVSQVFLAVPMVGLYLLGVGVAFLFGGVRRAKPDTERAVET